MQKKNGVSVLIVGVGNIGKILYDEYQKLHPDRYDPRKGYDEKRDIVYDLAFICVDTPMNDDGSCDIGQVKTALGETKSKVYVIRSTVPPTTTESLKKETGKRIVFAPEFYGTTQHCDPKNFDYNFMILGGDKRDVSCVIQVLQNVYDARYRFLITDSTTAELTKYFANTMLAAKVSMCVQFWSIAKQFGVCYEEMRELLLNDKRFSKSHTFVYEEHPYWESHCFDKDLPAVTKFANAPLIEAVIDYNKRCKNGETEN